MRRVVFSLAAGLVGVPLVALIGLSGCGDGGTARVEVARKKLLGQIDDALGKMDVQKAEIDAGIKSARQAADGVRRAKIKAQVGLEQLDERVRPHRERVARCDETLAKLRDAIKADTPAEFGGKTYTVAELKDMAGKVIQARQEAEGQIRGFDTARENMRAAVATLAKRQQELDARIAKLQAADTKLEAEMAAARAMKQASAAMGDGGGSLSDNLDDLEKKVAALSADVRAELSGESDKWLSAGADQAVGDVNAFIKSAQAPADPVADIDRILGPVKK